MKKVIIVSLLIAAIWYPAAYLLTRPQYSLMTGNNCINCHLSPSGGGQRSVLGAYARNMTSLIKDEGLINFFDSFNEIYSFADGKFLWGFDDRVQSARIGDPSDSKRRTFPMQFTPYLTYFTTEWLSFSGSLNILYVPDMVTGKTKAFIYPGQRSWAFSATMQPSLDWPSLKVGFFSPSIGTKYDDHTLFIRQVWTNRPQTVIAPDNSEIGGELSYNYRNWLQLTAGAFGSGTMSEIKVKNLNQEDVSLVKPDGLAYLGKFVLSPKLFDKAINTYFGGAYFLNGDYNIVSGFLGLGLTDFVSLISEIAMTEKNGFRRSTNYMIDANLQIFDGINLSLRYEHANTHDYTLPDSEANTDYTNYDISAYILGANIYPIPNVEIRPEYRIIDRKNFESYAAQWAVQLHLYY